MPKTREQKQQIVEELADKLKRMTSAVFTSIAGYTMADADKLRAQGRKEGVELMVAKKTLLARALEKAGLNLSVDAFPGSILTTIGFKDEVAPAKMMAAYAKERETVKIAGGILEGKLVDAAAIKTLAKLPGKLELYAKLVGTLNAPISGFVNVLSGNLRGLVVALSAIKEAKGKA